MYSKSDHVFKRKLSSVIPSYLVVVFRKILHFDWFLHDSLGSLLDDTRWKILQSNDVLSWIMVSMCSHHDYNVRSCIPKRLSTMGSMVDASYFLRIRLRNRLCCLQMVSYWCSLHWRLDRRVTRWTPLYLGLLHLFLE